jgi:hypothetical protein
MDITDDYYGYIYKTILPNGKIYIGQTTNFNWKSYLGSGTEILKFLKENGKSGVTKEILKYCKNQNILDKWERILIKRFDSTNKNIGLNIQLGGAGRGIFADITKNKISDSVSKTMTNERRLLISKQHKGKFVSEETRKRNSLASSGENNSMFGIRGIESPIFGRRFINNGEICKLVYLENENKLPQGFILGRLNKIKL